MQNLEVKEQNDEHIKNCCGFYNLGFVLYYCDKYGG
jgi:hypothetical protein